MVEGTIAGLAAGLVALNRVPLEECTFLSTKLEVLLNGRAVDLALVDAAVYDDLFVASRAVWDLDKIRQIFLNRAEPDSIGLSSIGGLLHPVAAEEPRCLYLELGGNGRSVTAAVAPGMIKQVHIKNQKILGLGEEVEVDLAPSILALDGEREVEVKRAERAAIRLSRDGPIVVNVKRTMTAAMKRGILSPDAHLDLGVSSMDQEALTRQHPGESRLKGGSTWTSD
jgi:hypothetical protein